MPRRNSESSLNLRCISIELLLYMIVLVSNSFKKVELTHLYETIIYRYLDIYIYIFSFHLDKCLLRVRKLVKM